MTSASLVSGRLTRIRTTGMNSHTMGVEHAAKFKTEVTQQTLSTKGTVAEILKCQRKNTAQRGMAAASITFRALKRFHSPALLTVRSAYCQRLRGSSKFTGYAGKHSTVHRPDRHRALRQQIPTTQPMTTRKQNCEVKTLCSLARHINNRKTSTHKGFKKKRLRRDMCQNECQCAKADCCVPAKPAEPSI